jgi:hypothetical protein
MGHATSVYGFGVDGNRDPQSGPVVSHPTTLSRILECPPIVSDLDQSVDRRADVRLKGS